MIISTLNTIIKLVDLTGIALLPNYTFSQLNFFEPFESENLVQNVFCAISYTTVKYKKNPQENKQKKTFTTYKNNLDANLRI